MYWVEQNYNEAWKTTCKILSKYLRTYAKEIWFPSSRRRHQNSILHFWHQSSSKHGSRHMGIPEQTQQVFFSAEGNEVNTLGARFVTYAAGSVFETLFCRNITATSWRWNEHTGSADLWRRPGLLRLIFFALLNSIQYPVV